MQHPHISSHRKQYSFERRVYPVDRSNNSKVNIYLIVNRADRLSLHDQKTETHLAPLDLSTIPPVFFVKIFKILKKIPDIGSQNRNSSDNILYSCLKNVEEIQARCRND